MSLQKVKIGSFLNRIKKTTTIEDSKLYKRITIRTKHQGISKRDEVKGLNIGTKAQFIVNTGQFLLSKIDARLGAFGIVPPELDNGIITGNFWAYEVDKKKVNIEWFNLFTSSGNFYDICNIASSGTTHRKYLDEKKFLNFEITIPSVAEQNVFLEKFKKQKINFVSLSTELQHQSDLIKKLRQSILQDAVQGKLNVIVPGKNQTL
jgi:type I restriction enzyme S subunit